MPHEIRIAVIGAGRCGEDLQILARELGQCIAQRGWTLVCGGLGGVMEASAQGAADAGGKTIGILPGSDRNAANAHIGTAIVTGMGQMRNALVVANADVVIAVGGRPRHPVRDRLCPEVRADRHRAGRMGASGRRRLRQRTGGGRLACGGFS